MSWGTRLTIGGLLLSLLLSGFWAGCSDRGPAGVPAVHSDQAVFHSVLTLFFDGVPSPDDKMVQAQAVNTDPNVPAIRKRPEVAWYVHEPVKDCAQCHGSRQGRRFSSEVRLVAQPPQLCYKCHKAPVQAAPGGWVHGPYAAGECILCHEPHKTTNPHLLREPIPSLCYKCHPELAKGADPNEAKKPHSQCTRCHAAHAGPANGPGGRTPEVCYTCHESLAPNALKGWAHGPVAIGQCQLCHQPHQTGNPYQLTERIPALCYGCHEETSVKSIRGHRLQSYADCSQCHESHTSLERPLLKPGVLRDVAEAEIPESVYGSSGR